MNGSGGPQRPRLGRGGRSLRSVLSDGHNAGTVTDFFIRAFAETAVMTTGASITVTADKSHRLCRLEGEAMPFPITGCSRKRSLVIHAAHTTHSARRHARRSLGLRPVSHHPLGGDQQPGD